jgi:hypothetical protein
MGGLSFGLHIALVISFVSLFAWGCDRGATGSSSGVRRPPMGRPTGYHVVDVVNGGTLTGTVLWTGPLPEVVRVTVEQDRDACGSTREMSALSVSPRGGVRDTVVYLDSVAEGRALPTGPFEIAFRGCELVPHVSAVPMGASLTFANREAGGVLHNLHATLVDGSVWADLGLPESGATATATVPGLGVSTLVDDAAHPWIRGFVHSFDHPYFAVTNADGQFRITGVPPGQYTIRTWHEGVRAARGEGTVSGRPRMSQPLVLSRPVVAISGSETTVDFELDLVAVDAAGD